MLKMKLWVDADSCPTLLREYLILQAKKNNLVADFVANRNIFSENTKFENHFKMTICETGKDVADNYIFDNVQNNDIVVTRDILFAQRLVEKNITVLNDRGISFNKDNIQDRLIERNLSLNLSQIGFGGNKKSSYSQNELKKFISTFEYELPKHITNEIYSVKR